MKTLLSIVIFIIFFSFFNTPVNAACGASTYCSVSGGTCSTNIDTTCGLVASGACIGFAGGSSCIGNYCYGGSHYQTVCDASCCSVSAGGGFGGTCAKLVEYGFCDVARVPGAYGATDGGCILPPAITRSGDNVTVNWGCAHDWGQHTAPNGAVQYEGLALYKITVDNIKTALSNNNYDYIKSQFVGVAPNKSTSFTFSDTTLTSFPVFIIPNCVVSSNLTTTDIKVVVEGPGNDCNLSAPAPVYPDTTPPVCGAWTFDPTSPSGADSISIVSTASDSGSGLKTSGLYVAKSPNGSIWTGWDALVPNDGDGSTGSVSDDWSTLGKADGTYRVASNWWDNASNSQQCTTTYTIDGPPTCTLTPASASLTTGGTQTFTLKAVDNDASVSYAVSTSAGTVTPAPITPLPTITADGIATKPIGFTALSVASSPTVTVVVTDSKSQTGSCEPSITVTAPAPDYSLILSKTTASLNKGGVSDTVVVRLRDVAGATDWTTSVALTCTVTDKSGVSAGTKPTCSLNPTSKVPASNGDSTLTITTGTATGDFNVKVEGTGTQGTQVNLKRSANLVLTVTAPPSDPPPTCTLTPASASLTTGGTQTFTLKAVDNDASVSYAVSTSAGTVTPAPITPLPTITADGIATKPIGFTALSVASSPTVTVVVTDSKSQTGSCEPSITVTAPAPDYSLILSKTTASLNKGGVSDTVVVRLRDVAGATDWTTSVALTCTVTDKSGVSAGTKPTCSLNPTSKVPASNGDSTLTVTTGTATGDFNIKVEGTGTQGTQVNLKRSANLVLTVTAPVQNPSCPTAPVLNVNTTPANGDGTYKLGTDVSVTANLGSDEQTPTADLKYVDWLSTGAGLMASSSYQDKPTSSIQMPMVSNSCSGISFKIQDGDGNKSGVCSYPNTLCTENQSEVPKCGYGIAYFGEDPDNIADGTYNKSKPVRIFATYGTDDKDDGLQLQYINWNVTYGIDEYLPYGTPSNHIGVWTTTSPSSNSCVDASYQVQDTDGNVSDVCSITNVLCTEADPLLAPDYSLTLSKSIMSLNKGGVSDTAVVRLRDVVGAEDWTNNVALTCTVTDKSGVSAGTKPTCSLSPTTKVPSTSPDASGDSTLTVTTGTATGDFNIKVEGTGTQGIVTNLKRSANLVLTVLNTAPVCSLSLSGTNITGQPANVFELDSDVTVTATASDADGDPISYSWSITDTPDGVLTASASDTATYKTPTNFNKLDNVQLQVSDGSATGTCSVDIKSENSYTLSGKVYKVSSIPSQSDADICSAITNISSLPGASGITLSDKKYTFSSTSANLAGNYNNLKLSVRDGKVKLCLNLTDPAYIDLQIVDSCAIDSGNLEFSKITGSANCIEITSTAGALTTGNVGALNIPLKLVPNPYFVVFDGDIFSAQNTILNRPSSTNFNPANNYERFISKYNDHSASAKSGVLISQGSITTQWDNDMVDFTSNKGVDGYSGISGSISSLFTSAEVGIFDEIKALSDAGELTTGVVYKDADFTIDNSNYASYQQKIIYVKGDVTIETESIPPGQILNYYIIATGEIDIPQITCPKCRNTLTINGGLVANVGSNGSATVLLNRSIVPNNVSDDFYKKPSIIFQLNPALFIDDVYDQARIKSYVYKEIL